MPVSTRILIAERESLFAELLGDYLLRIVTDGVIQRVRTVSELKRSEFEYAIVDLVLADGDVVDWLRSCSDRGTLKRVIVLTSCEKEYLLHSVVQLAIGGIVHKAETLQFFEIALKTVIAGGSSISPHIQELRVGLHSSPSLYSKILSPKEQVVLKGIATRKKVTEIAKDLRVAPATIIDHRKNIMRKLDIHSQFDLITYAIEAGFAPERGGRPKPPRKARS
jgi:DNA-binding NarL/FixJ family response regulator